VTVACGVRDQRQTAFGPAVVTDVASTFCNPCVRARHSSNWCRRGKSNRRATLKSLKLLILQSARNAKTAKNVFLGYAAATRRGATNFHGGRNRGYAKNYFGYGDQLTVPHGSPFPHENPARKPSGINQFRNGTEISVLASFFRDPATFLSG